ncbi:MAG: MerR family DNA-binding transcriptional regulator [Deltaproteobacteria bacterium]|nr:MerR family DNA-binding transcriptional regulator [Deltaproteobacteria bacterium]
MTARQQAAQDVGGKLSIGALSRATGIPVETLRTWELRYGFPLPERKPSGHRVYPVTSVPRLRRIAEALTHGHRAREAVTASDKALSSLLIMSPGASAPAPRSVEAEPEVTEVTELLRFVETFNTERLTRGLLTDWKRMKPLAFLQTRIAPLLHAVGEEWAAARLEIRHERFLSERVSDVLRSVRMPFEEKASGPLVVCATLPSEEHGLGLQMVALLLAVAGCRVLFLGTEVPPTQIASLARDLNARAVAVSVSIANRGEPMAGQLTFLRGLLPRRVTFAVGGAGAPGTQPGLKIFQDLGEVAEWGRQLMGETEKR